MNEKTPGAQAPTSWQDHVSHAQRYLADAQLYPLIANGDLVKAQMHISWAITAWYVKQAEKAA